MKMDKKTLIIIGVVILVAVAAYGYNRWRQQQMAAQVLSAIYGGNPLAGGAISNQAAQELAKQAAALAAAQTPEDKFNATPEVGAVGTLYQDASTVIKPKIEKVFGQTKLAGYNAYGSDAGFIAIFMVPRAVSSADMTAMAKAFTDDGYAVMSEQANTDTATVMLVKKGVAQIVLSTNEQGKNQQVSVMYSPQQQAPTP